MPPRFEPISKASDSPDLTAPFYDKTSSRWQSPPAAAYPVLYALNEYTTVISKFLAQVPLTWQFVSRGLDYKQAHWHAALPLKEFSWNPQFRDGHDQNSAIADLAAITSPGGDLAAHYLRIHFSTYSLDELRGCILESSKRCPSRLAKAEWWAKLPIPLEHATASLAELRDLTVYLNFNSVNAHRHALGFFKPIIRKEVESFFTLQAAKTDVQGLRAAGIFGEKNAVCLPHRIKKKLTPFLFGKLSSMVTAVALENQLSSAVIEAYIAKRTNDEVRHTLHIYLGILQQDLLGRMISAQFPLVYFQELAAASEPLKNLPEGRRHHLTGSEAATFFSVLSRKIIKIEKILHRRGKTGKAGRSKNSKKWLKSFASRIRNESGQLAFNHLSTIFLYDWVTGCRKILDTVQPKQLQNLRKAKADVASFESAILDIQALSSTLMVHNMGLAAIIFNDYVDRNAVALGRDNRDIASLIKEETSRCIASFNFKTGNRFATYMYRKIKFVLRRRPSQEQQLVKLSADYTTALPRLRALANACEQGLANSNLESLTKGEGQLFAKPNSPEFYKYLAEHYNLSHGKEKGRTKLTAAMVEELLNSQYTESLDAPANPNPDEQSSPIQLADDSTAIDSSTNNEVEEALEKTLSRMDPVEGFVLAMTTDFIPREAASDRFDINLATLAKERAHNIIKNKSKALKPIAGSSHKTIRVTPVGSGLISQRAIRPTPDEANAQNANGNKSSVPTAVGDNDDVDA